MKKKELSKSNKTKDVILKAAQTLFIEKGFAGTSMSQIAAAANVTQSLIHHHFDTKENIWKEVKLAILRQAEIEGNISFEVDPKQDLRTTLEIVLRARLNLYQANPALVRLMAWQELDAKHSALPLCGGTKASPDKWVALFQDLKKQNKIRATIDEGMAALMMYGAISAFNHPFPFLPNASGTEEYLQFVVEGLTKSFS